MRSFTTRHAVAGLARRRSRRPALPRLGTPGIRWPQLSLRVAIACLALLGSAATAGADSLSLTTTPSSVGVGQTVTITASGEAGDESPALALYVTPASVGCGPDPNSLLSGEADGDDVFTDAPDTLNPGPFSSSGRLATNLDSQFDSDNPMLQGPIGTYLACGYLYDIDNTSGLLTTDATASADLTLRYPNDSLTLSPSFHVAADRPFDIPISYDKEPGTMIAWLSAYAKGPGRTCATSSGPSVWALSPGAHTVTWANAASRPGPYDMCANITVDQNGTAITLATAAATVVIGAQSSAPTTGCRVPNVIGDSLARARQALKQHDCGAGSVVRRTAHAHKPGTVISQNVKPGTHLRADAKIDLVIAKRQSADHARAS